MIINAVILAAGRAERFKDKLFKPLKGKPVLWHSLSLFQNHPAINEIVIVANKRNKDKVENIAKEFLKVQKIILGGSTRQDSVWAGTRSIGGDLIVIHNGENPGVTPEEVGRSIAALKKHMNICGVGVGNALVDTVKTVRHDGQVEKTFDRGTLWAMQTPQIVRRTEFLEAYKKARRKKVTFTDDLALLEWDQKPCMVIPAAEQNFKITTELDLIKMQAVLDDFPGGFSVGYGEDAHRFSRTHRGLRLGGVVLPDEFKLEADSDGDVVLHALAAAISQALGGGSLGTFAAPLFAKGVTDSSRYLDDRLRLLKKKNLHVQTIGITIEGKTPRIDVSADAIRAKLNILTNTPIFRIGITAHTGDGLTSFGRGEGLRCVANVILAPCH